LAAGRLNAAAARPVRCLGHTLGVALDKASGPTCSFWGLGRNSLIEAEERARGGLAETRNG
jgi:hypothetical protein